MRGTLVIEKKVDEQKKCFYCGSEKTQKYGRVKGVQRYKCYVCGRQFVDRKKIDTEELWRKYVYEKQTYAQLAARYHCSIKTIQRKIDSVALPKSVEEKREVVVLMDTTYWHRGYGVMLFMDALSGRDLLWYFVKYETNALYKEGIEELKRRGYHVLAIVCDGRRGLAQLFPQEKVQQCQFHQQQIVRRYLKKTT